MDLAKHLCQYCHIVPRHPCQCSHTFRGAATHIVCDESCQGPALNDLAQGLWVGNPYDSDAAAFGMERSTDLLHLDWQQLLRILRGKFSQLRTADVDEGFVCLGAVFHFFDPTSAKLDP
eukprot:1147574-Pelagomonas_calceolata.AAC.1